MNYEKLPSGLFIASIKVWDGEKWTTKAEEKAKYGPSLIGTLCGFPVYLRPKGWKDKGFQELFYHSPSLN